MKNKKNLMKLAAISAFIVGSIGFSKGAFAATAVKASNDVIRETTQNTSTRSLNGKHMNEKHANRNHNSENHTLHNQSKDHNGANCGNSNYE